VSLQISWLLDPTGVQKGGKEVLGPKPLLGSLLLFLKGFLWIYKIILIVQVHLVFSTTEYMFYFPFRGLLWYTIPPNGGTVVLSVFSVLYSG
jgi:hypothetical protein